MVIVKCGAYVNLTDDVAWHCLTEGRMKERERMNEICQCHLLEINYKKKTNEKRFIYLLNE